MKKKLILALILTVVFTCLFVIGVSAETPSMYIEFGARFPGSSEYITVYTENAESTGNPKIDFANKKFYSDVDFTAEVDMSTATGIDFSVTKTYVNGVEGNPVTRMMRATDPYVNCTEVKWFLAGMPTISYNSQFTFKDWTGLKSFDFGNATAIGDNVFENTGFETLTIPSTITKIYGSSFKDCVSLTTITFEGAFNSAGNGSVFSGCTALNTINFGTTTTIGKSAFKKCTSLTSVTIPSTITTIESSAFEQSGLTSITIPKTVTSLGSSAFYECKSLATVVFEEGFNGTLGNSCFCSTTALKNLTLVEGITNIPYQCFYGTGLESIVLPDSVIKIDNRGFSQSSSLTTFTISENSRLQTMGSCLNATKITSLYLPKGVKITDSPFSGCNYLETIYNLEYAVIAITVDGVEQNIIPNSFFSECRALKVVKLPQGITSIGKDVFNRCGALETVVIPASVTAINKDVFPSTTAWLSPKNAVIYYCGGNAEKLLSLTNDESGNVSAFLSERIAAGSVVEYSGMETAYSSGYIVSNANTCDLYYAGVHTWGAKTPMFEGKEYVTAYVNASTCAKCAKNDVVDTICGPLFIDLGYAKADDGTAFTYDIKLNKANILIYEQNTGKTLNYGFIVGSYTEGETGDIVDLDGKATIQKSVVTDFAEVQFSNLNKYSLKMTGIKADQYEMLIYCNAYVLNGEAVSYMGATTDSGKALAVSYKTLPVKQ